MIARRTFIKSASVVALASTAAEISVGRSEAQRVPKDARVEEYRMLQKRTGTSRNIVVTPLAYVHAGVNP